MSRYVMLRVVQGIITLLLASIVIFLLARLSGDPVYVMLSDQAPPEEVEVLTRHLGLDKPMPEQYAIFITNLVKGDLGKSLYYKRPVSELILERLPATIMLGLAAMIVSLIISIPAGVLAAVKKDRWEDTIAKGFAILGQSMPTFWLAIVLIWIVAVILRWLPAGGFVGIESLILPAIALGYHSTAGSLRLTRSSMLDVLRTDYVRLAKIKGVSNRLVIWKHAFRNSLIPVVTFTSLSYARFLRGSVVVETVFGWPGVGRLAYEGIRHHDFPVMQGVLILFTGVFIVANLLTDILYVYLDPRVRYVKE
ncbi:ABC transporter permease [Chloroflexota bacterium]